MRITKALLPLLAVSLLGGCEKAPESMRPIEGSRIVERFGRDRPRTIGAQDRFFIRERSGEMTQAPQESSGLIYDVPPGWLERPARSMRQIDFQVGGHADAECYFSVLPGGAGGLAANVNRWYKQMGQSELSAEQVSKLRKADFLSFDATLVDIEGTFSGGLEKREDWRLVGLIWFHEQAGIFLKMTGPRKVLAGEFESFLKLARDMRLPDSARSASKSEGSEPTKSTSGRPRGTTPANGNGELAWELPQGWNPGPNRAMRVANFLVGTGDPVECYITFLGSMAGQELPNVNRWRSQLGQEPLSAIEGETRIPMLGQNALFVEISGSSGDSEGMMLAAMCTLSDRSVFVKMLGARETVEPQKEAFLSFCKSLRLGE